MKFPGIRKRSLPTRRVALCALWLAGLGLIYWLTPYQPKAIRQPPQDDMVLGFLQDNRTLVTQPVSQGFIPIYQGLPTTERQTLGPQLIGAPQLFDVETGETRSVPVPLKESWTEIVPQQRQLLARNLRAVETDQTGSRLLIQERVDNDSVEEEFFRIIDPSNGKEQCEIAVPYARSARWYVSPDDRVAVRWREDRELVLPSFEGHRHVDVYDLSSRKLLWTARSSGGVCFSADGNLLAVRNSDSLQILKVRNGELLVPALNCPDFGLPVGFSPDGRFVVGSSGLIWDVSSAKVRGLDPSIVSALFSADGKTVIAVASFFSRCELRCYDVASGQEFPERRKTLLEGPQARMALYWPVANRQILWVDGETAPSQPNLIEQWLARIPGLERWGQTRNNHVHMLIDLESGRMTALGHDYLRAVSNDGRYLVTAGESGVRLWELPLRTPWRSVLVWGGAWSMVLAAVGLVLRRRERRRGGAIDQGASEKTDSKAAFADAGL
jgi:hypothetical protein